MAEEQLRILDRYGQRRAVCIRRKPARGAHAAALRVPAHIRELAECVRGSAAGDLVK